MIKKRKSKVKSVIVCLIIIVIGAGIITSVFMYAESIRKPAYFVMHKRTLAERIYNEILVFDYFAPGPDDPEKILDINNKINLLIYGDMLTSDELLGSLLEKQRLLYTESLRSASTFSDQYENLVNGLAEYKEQKTVCYDISTQPPRRHPDYDDVIVARVVWQTNNMGEITWEYTLHEDEEGRVRIQRFLPVK